jgi:acyl-CoA synthetase (AMP-forming)/AMP-acid ligase II
MVDPTRPLFPEILELHGKWLERKPAVVAPDATATWSELVRSIHQVANGLRATGVETGDRVGIVMGNSLETVEVIFGIIFAGACAVPINLSIQDMAIETMLRDAGVRALFVTKDQLSRVLDSSDLLKSLVPGGLICAGEAPSDPGWRDYRQWRNSQSSAEPCIPISEDIPSNIIYSSGTTGTPKGILHTQGGRLDWAYDLAIALRYHRGARTLVTLGLYSNISWAMMLCTFLAGGTLLLHAGFDATAVLAEIDKGHATHTAMVPLQYQRLFNHPGMRHCDVSSMQAMVSVGSSLPVALKSQIIERFRCGVIELYGLTEGVITALDPEDAQKKLASVGKPIQGTDIRLVDEHGQDVPAGSAGEIVGRCRFNTPGYWNREDATKQATFTDERGRKWLRTGDIGRLDEDGFLYIVDRKKDMILSGGQNIYPADIESVVMMHEAVLECAVIGVPDPEWGETHLAFVVSRDQSLSSERLLRWINERVGRQQRVCAVVFRDTLPRNPNGKIMKRELRDSYLSDGV